MVKNAALRMFWRKWHQASAISSWQVGLYKRCNSHKEPKTGYQTEYRYFRLYAPRYGEITRDRRVLGYLLRTRLQELSREYAFLLVDWIHAIDIRVLLKEAILCGGNLIYPFHTIIRAETPNLSIEDDKLTNRQQRQQRNSISNAWPCYHL